MNPVLLAALGLFLVFLLFYVVWGLFLCYHLFRFSPRKDVAAVGTTLFAVVTLFILLVAAASFNQIETDAPLRFQGDTLSPKL